ncbi:MAG TPA: hypothetical protein VGE62_01495 [Candidatus Paceibacterota bacterium]
MESNPENRAPWQKVAEEEAAVEYPSGHVEVVREVETGHARELAKIREDKMKNFSDPTELFTKMEKVTAFVNRLRDRVGDAELERYRAYHALVGSTPMADVSDLMDLPGGEIEKFIRHEL